MKKKIMKKWKGIIEWFKKSEVSKELQKAIKKHVFQYFEHTANEPRPSDLGANKLKFYYMNNILYMEITLERPGLLIGKKGRTIDGVIAYIKDSLEIFKEYDFKIKINEGSVWD